MTQTARPYGSHGCWGQQFTDGDRECVQCIHKDSCRAACMERAVRPPVQAQPAMVPMPARPYIPQPIIQPPPAPVQQGYRPPVALVQAPQPAPQIVQYQPQYQQPSQVASLPDPNNPNPLIPMLRPGAPQPAYYFCQYPGETTVQRLGKNMALRAAESMFGELMFFFRHWTWPPHS